ncbi:alpha/beta fold hydrolase [Subtercola vilae]|uniref:Alpha/beta hydrolase n=1 Tax=Subtercola vilae TaxID=2056433 RepID=A0A4T2BUS8_9MICO|nr:alpha/beta hydrolase [Subtercola vilae]TIH35140.1 alpha/beta hydrolase [Subtercola vilae]
MTGDRGYAPFGIVADPGCFGLKTSVIATGAGAVTVRHTATPATLVPRTGSVAPSLPAPPTSLPPAALPRTALVLLHGAAGSWSTFTPLLQAARRAGLDLGDLVIPDLPGWGDTALPADPNQRTIEAISSSVAEVTRALGYDSWVLLGHSLGGFVALDLAAHEPRATEKVLLVSATTFSVIESVRHPIRRFRGLPAYIGMLFVMRTLAALGRSGTRLVNATGDTRLFRLVMSPLFAHPHSVDATVMQALAEEARPRSFAEASARAGQYDAARVWAGIRCPVLALHGSADVFVADSDDALLDAVIPDFTAHTVEGAGHFGHIERPDAVLEDFFAPASLPTKAAGMR